MMDYTTMFDEVFGLREVSRRPTGSNDGLMSLAEFRRYRDEHVIESIRARLTELEKKALSLEAAYYYARRAVDREPDKQKKKHLEEALYARDGLAWQWANADADLSSSENDPRYVAWKSAELAV